LDSNFILRDPILATASGDGTIRLWNYNDGKSLRVFNDHLQAVWSCAFHDSGDYIVSGSMDQTSKVFDLRT
jgi:WD40 repeat protein